MKPMDVTCGVTCGGIIIIPDDDEDNASDDENDQKGVKTEPNNAPAYTPRSPSPPPSATGMIVYVSSTHISFIAGIYCKFDWKFMLKIVDFIGRIEMDQ